MSVYFKVILGVAIGVLLIRGGFGALLGAAKVAGPLFAVYYLTRQVKRMLASAPEKSHVGGESGGPGETIEICPQCGREKKKRHRCT